eukprot:scaffold75588_cov24-Prasinocladus_malaysianus.AAC.1
MAPSTGQRTCCSTDYVRMPADSQAGFCLRQRCLGLSRSLGLSGILSGACVFGAECIGLAWCGPRRRDGTEGLPAGREDRRQDRADRCNLGGQQGGQGYTAPDVPGPRQGQAGTEIRAVSLSASQLAARSVLNL